MAIDLGNNPVGTPPTADQSLQIKSVLNLENVENVALSTWTGSENLSLSSSQIIDFKRIGFSAIKSNTTIFAGSNTIVTFDEELDDTHNAWDGSVFTIPSAGMYEIFGVYTFASVSDGNKYIIGIAKNTTTTLHTLLGRGVSGGSNITGSGGAVRMQLNAGDQIRMLVYCDNATTGSNTVWGYCSFSAYKMYP